MRQIGKKIDSKMSFLGILIILCLIVAKIPSLTEILKNTWPANFLSYKDSLTFFFPMWILISILAIPKKPFFFATTLISCFVGVISTINFLTGQGLSLVIATGYTLAIWQLAQILCKLVRTFNLTAIKILIFIILNILVSILLNYLGFLNKSNLISIALIGFLSSTNTIKRLSKINVEASSYIQKTILATATLALAGFAGLLMNQPIIEWDSSHGHIPTVLHYFHSQSFSGNPYNIQTYAYNIHHIGALPYYAIGANWGLKFWNFLNVLGIFISILTFLLSSTKRNSSNVEDGILVSLLCISPSIIYSTIGTFQYDVPLLLYSVIILSLLRELYLQYPKVNTLYSLLIIIASALSATTKLSFLAIIPILGIAILTPYFKARKIPWVLIFSSVLICAVLLLINLLRSGQIFFPYDYIAKASESDWKNYGTNLGTIVDIILFVPGIALESSKFGHLNNGTASIAILLGFVAILDLWRNKSTRVVIIFFMLTLIVAIIPTRYVRYSIFVWGLLPLFIYWWLKELTGLKKLYVKYIASFILLLQITLIPSLNWWIKLPGNLFTESYNENKKLEEIRGKDLKDLREIERNIAGRRTIFISKNFAAKFYWINMLYPTPIVPLVWQSGTMIALPQSSKDINNILNSFSAGLFIIPESELMSFPLISNFKTIYKNETYHLFER